MGLLLATAIPWWGVILISLCVLTALAILAAGAVVAIAVIAALFVARNAKDESVPPELEP